MLNTLPPSGSLVPGRGGLQPPFSTPYPQGKPQPGAEAPVPILRRRWGGQPSNRNALNHGLYTAKKPHPSHGDIVFIINLSANTGQ